MPERKTSEDIARERALAVMVHDLSAAMGGLGEVTVTLKSRAKLTGAPSRLAIDATLKNRGSNLRVYMNGYDFPMDDVIGVRR